MNTLQTMSDYIYATPNKILENLNQGRKLCDPLLQLYTKRKYARIVFVASGSSFTAIHCAKTFLNETLKTDITIINPYTFAHYEYRTIKDNDFVIVATQSGASTNCIEALKRLHNLHHERIVLTGNVHSDCKEYSDHIIDWNCGLESVGYVTLGVVSLISYLQIFASYCAKTLWNDNECILRCDAQIRKAMQHHIAISEKSETFITKYKKELMEMDRVYILGCGSNYGTALEGALKIGETMKVLAVAYELDEFLHGPALQLTPRYSIFIIDNNDETSVRALQVYKALKKVSNHVFIIGNVVNSKSISVSNPCDEPFTCLYHLAFFQLIAERISTQLISKRSHPLYYEMNKILDFRTTSFRKHTPADQD